MPNLTCEICGTNFQYPKKQVEFFENYLQGECSYCFSILAKQRYQVNIKDGVTFFYGMRTEALGDSIVRQVIEDEYLKANPDEHVYFFEDFNTIQSYKEKLGIEKVDKIFWANWMSPLPAPKDAMWFSITSEAEWYAKQDKYCRVNFQESKPNIGEIFAKRTDLIYQIKQPEIINGSNNNIVFHIRNLPNKTGRDPNKNMPAHEVLLALKLLEKYQYDDTIGKIYLVGNDVDSKGCDLLTIKYMLPSIQIIDLRNLLNLSEILYILNRSILFFGRDSGLVHLAAASQCPNILSYCFQDMNWLPKCEPKRILGSFHKSKPFLNTLEAMENFLRGL